jgi:hypothetical protein
MNAPPLRVSTTERWLFRTRWCEIRVRIDGGQGGLIESEAFWININRDTGMPSRLSDDFLDELQRTTDVHRLRWTPCLTPGGREDAEQVREYTRPSWRLLATKVVVAQWDSERTATTPTARRRVDQQTQRERDAARWRWLSRRRGCRRHHRYSRSTPQFPPTQGFPRTQSTCTASRQRGPPTARVPMVGGPVSACVEAVGA